MYLSKSIYCKCVQCKKIHWLDKYKSEVKEELNNDAVFENGNEVGDLARNLFGTHTTIPFSENLSNMIKDTKEELEKENNIICEASFSYNDNFCSVDILKKNGNNYEIYEVKSSTRLSDIYLDDISYQYYVLSNLGLNVTSCYLVNINTDYVRQGKLELDKLFKLNDVTKEVLLRQDKVKQVIYESNEYMSNYSEREESLDKKCFSPYPCPYFKYCHKLPSPNVFDIANMQQSTKINLYKKGIYTYDKLIKENLNPKCLEQISFELYNKDDYIDKSNIKNFLLELTYPLYFLDFESFQPSIPLYNGVRPYMQIPFQYSLHYLEKEDGILNHKEFLAEPGIDPRRSLAESLIKDIPKDTCVLAYNMTFEKTRIRELANLFPDLKDHLLNIESNIKDLMIPFQNRWYYSKNMKGSYSIKYVLPALYPSDPELDYHNLPVVHNGSEAANAYINIKNKTEEEIKIIKEGLLEYCGLDTLAMVKIYNKLREVCNEKKN